MRVVGDALVKMSLLEADANSADLFGRSAFNRYYYASYLIVRDLLSRLDKNWASQGHASIPDLLERAIPKKIKPILLRQERDGLITSGYAARKKSEMLRAVSDVSNVMRSAYDVRCIADYEPDKKITKDSGGVIFLNGSKISEAEDWVSTVDSRVKVMLRIFKELGLV